MLTRLRRPAVALLATTLTSTLAAGVLVSTPATAVATTSITGTVTGAGSGGLSDVQVDLYQWDEEYDYWAYLASEGTDANGHYTYAGAPGEYRVSFHSYSGDFAGEYYQDAPDVDTATTVVLPTTGSVVVDAELAAANLVSGHVTDLEGNPAGMPVLALRVTGSGPSLDYELTDVTLPDDTTGAYELDGLPDGRYRIGFNPFIFGSTPWAAEWYDDQVSLYSAQEVVVSGGQTVTGIDAELAPAATIAGTVTGADDEALQNVQVTVLVKVDHEWVPANYASTDAQGSYVVPSVAAATYRVSFSYRDPETGQYLTEHWQDKGKLANAKNLSVATGQGVTGIDSKLVAGEHDAESVAAVENVVAPTITGTPVVGSTLTASTGSWSPAPYAFYYEWLRDGEFIMGSYDSTYVPTAEDVGHSISVFVTAVAEDHDAGNAMSVGTAPVTQPAVTPPVVTPPVVTPPVATPPAVTPAAALTAILQGLDVKGAPKVGSTVKLTGLDASFRTAVTYELQWYAGSKAIKKATKSKLKITSAMKGRKISVKVTATAAGAKVTKKLILGKAR